MKSWESRWYVLCAILIFANLSGFAKTCLAPTPPMGWNSWNCVGHGVSEELICGIADAMVESGMKDVGYTYVVIDDMWHKGRVDAWHADEKGDMVSGGADVPGRDDNGTLICDPEKFPNGIQFVADYVHSRGLKFGLYTVPGKRTCAGCTGSRGYEKHDLETFANWGVDFIKLDHCGVKGDVREVMKVWRRHLDGLDRPIVLSVNMGITDWIDEYADMWRTTTDIMGVWNYKPGEFCLMASISDIIDLQLGLEDMHGPCGWNDPDMLQVGNWDLTEEENKAHFGMWCILGAPLIAGNDLRKMNESTRTILTNRELIAVDQDPLGHRGVKVRDLAPGMSLWAKRLADPTHLAIALLNNTEQSKDMQIRFSDLGMDQKVLLRDLWQHKDLGQFKDTFSTTVPAHGVRIYLATAFERIGNFAPLPGVGEKGLVLQAEDPAQYYGGGTILSHRPGFRGSGYVQGKNHAWRAWEFTWIVPCAEEGDYELVIRYGMDVEGAHRYGLTVNEKPLGQIEFTSTGAQNWAEARRNVTLKKGYNRIRLNSPANDQNDIALDYLRVKEAH